MKLLDVCDFQGGSQPPKNEWSFEQKENYVRMLQIRDFTQEARVKPEYVKKTNKLKYCEEDDILIGRYGASVGKILTGKSGAYNVAIMKSIPDTGKVRKQYMKYYFLSPIFQNYLFSLGGRAAQAGFSKDDLAKLEFKLVNFEIQDRAIKEFSCLEKAVEAKKNELSLLDELIKSRFIEMFGDLKSMQNSSIKMGDVVTINPKKDIIDDNLDVTFLPMEKVSVDGTIDVSTIRKYSEVKKGFNHVKENDVLFAKITPCMENGKSTIARGLCNGYANTTTELFALRCSDKVVPEYIYSIVHSKEFRIQAESNMTGSAGQRRVPKSFIEDFHINVPPMKDQLAYASFVEQVDKSKFVVQQQIKDLQELLDKKMDEYFSE